MKVFGVVDIGFVFKGCGVEVGVRVVEKLVFRE